MPIKQNYTAVVGIQNGDEGKGRFVSTLIYNAVDALSPNSEREILIYRFQGGPNAGHTVKSNGDTFHLHQLPSGIYSPQTYNLLGNGMLINPRKLVNDEIIDSQNKGLSISPLNLGISANAHMILDYHVHGDQACFNLAEHSSTGNGIRQAAVDKYNRVGIRFVHFLDNEQMYTFLKDRKFTNSIPDWMKHEFGDLKGFVDSYDNERRFLSDFLVQEHEIMNNPDFKRIIGEGAQGFMLCVNNGQYPGVTSSEPTAVPHRPSKIIGVMKSYVSSVGIADRPFVSAMDVETQNALRPLWKEFGVTTRKPRHLGWFDAVAARYAAQQSGVDSLALSCLDRLEELGNLDIPLKIVIGYKVDGRTYNTWQPSFHNQAVLARAEPIFNLMDSWSETVQDGTLTTNADVYKHTLEDLIGVPITFVGVGPNDKDVIIFDK